MRGDIDGLRNATNEYDKFQVAFTNYPIKEENLVTNYFAIADTDATNPILSHIKDAADFENQQIKSLKPSIDLVPFYPYTLKHLNGMVPVGFFCFGILLFVIPPVPKEFSLRWKRENLTCWWKSPSSLKWAFFSVIVLTDYHTPILIRNFLPLNEGRTVYGYSNIDISPISFLVMFVMDTIFMVLLVLIWAKWLAISTEVKRDLEEGKAFEYTLDPKVLKQLSELYINWQITSVLVAMPFLGFTFFYYDFMLKAHDERYLPQALNSHLLWAVTWIVISLPLIRRHYRWMVAKMLALAECKSRNDGEFGRRSKLFEQLRPYSTASVIMSASIGILTFIFPLIHGFWK
jgi:hypothetical protein